MIGKLQNAASDVIHEGLFRAVFMTIIAVVALAGCAMLLTGAFLALSTQIAPPAAAAVIGVALLLLSLILWGGMRLHGASSARRDTAGQRRDSMLDMFERNGGVDAVENYIRRHPAEAHLFALAAGAFIAQNPETLKIAETMLAEQRQARNGANTRH